MTRQPRSSKPAWPQSSDRSSSEMAGVISSLQSARRQSGDSQRAHLSSRPGCGAGQRVVGVALPSQPPAGPVTAARAISNNGPGEASSGHQHWRPLRRQQLLGSWAITLGHGPLALATQR